MKKLKQLKTKKAYFIVLVIGVMIPTVIAAVLALPNSEFRSSISDEARMDDLHLIELALNKSINEQMPSERKMPTKLSELSLMGLKGRLNDYEYKDHASTYHGGDYTLCTYFKHQGESNPENHSTYGGIEAYKFHHKGKSCFKNSVYKSSSHIQPL